MDIKAWLRQEKDIPPSSFEVTAPKAIAPLMQAFHVDLEEVASSLILEAARAIFGHDESGFDAFSKKDISTEELDGIASLMKGLKPLPVSRFDVAFPP